MADPSRRVLLASPLPPPPGGIATWTAILVRCGIPGFVPVVVNTRKTDARGSRIGRGLGELARTTRILSAMIHKTISARPAVVHVNCSLSPLGVFRDLLCGAIAKVLRKPLVTQYHGDIPDWVLRCRWFSTTALHGLLKLSDKNIALNTGSLAYISDVSPEPALLPNFIEDEVFERNNTPVRDGNSRGRGLYVGHVLPAKGMDHIRTVGEALPDIEFCLLSGGVGDIEGTQKTMPGNVKIMGAVERSEVLDEMRRSDFFFFPSHSEGFPNAVVEAMAMGMPIVATRVGAIPDMVVEGKGGFLVDRRDSEGLVAAIRNIMADQTLTRLMGEYNRERSRTRYSYSVVAGQLAELYESVARDRH